MSRRQQWLFEVPIAEWEALEVDVGRAGAPQTVKGFPRYQNTVASLLPAERVKINLAARRIVSSFQPGGQPIRTVRLVGHADLDTPRRPAVEQRISGERALAVERALIAAIRNPQIARRITWERVAAGATQLAVPRPTTEAERRRNWRVEILLSAPGIQEELEAEDFEEILDEEEEFEQEDPTIPVLSLDKLKMPGLPEITLTLGSSGQYEGFFREPPSSYNGEVKLSGRVQIEEAGTRRDYDYTRDRSQWPLRKAWANVEVSGAINSSDTSFPPVQRNGTFTTSTWIGYEPHLVRRLPIQVIVESKNGKRFGAKVMVELIDLQGFLAIVDPKEKTRPSWQTHLQFLASVRKIYEGGPNPKYPEFEGLFNWVLYRHRNVDPLFKLNTAAEQRLRLYKILYDNGEWIEIGHVLCGIEGSPKQKPDKGQSVPKPIRPDLIVTWAGDLGSVLQQAYIKDFWNAVDKGVPIDLNSYLVREASRSDLIGDIDGINIGSAYDFSRSLAENLNAYYGKKSRRRYHEFIANSKNEKGMAELPLVPGKPPPQAFQASSADDRLIHP